jgi:hypothetical protein
MAAIRKLIADKDLGVRIEAIQQAGARELFVLPVERALA